ncbi:diguanylate cyclase [Lysobacter sp. GX 14042]|uniref:ligand-binding sensor domain-containing diguanylate cyclase n=1 Tax=Lysobacter sp. GX 14042 TaxID=2907155 RepID=UPI001F385F52|nr:ligand-binding sensor domain-containing diguanylate cyclase [Lysobacter sp. GX 14042]MCE7031893.1 diguanylate cyclase [Lysobacter sp. GX 14042]
MPLRLLLAVVLTACLLPRAALALDPGKAFHHYVRDTWSVQQGMPQISAVDIAQTPDGYIWVATQAGVARFDGIGFTTHSPDTDAAIPHPVATALAVDASGDMWIGTRGGMALLRGGAFHPVPWLGGGQAPTVNGLYLTADGSVWAATSSGAARVDAEGLRPLPGSAPASAVLLRDGILWAGGATGVHLWDGRDWTSTVWPGGEAPVVQGLLEVGGEVWAATNRGLYIHGPDGWRGVPGAAGEEALPLQFLYRDSDGNIWSGGDLGLLRIRPDRSIETVPATRGNGLFNLFNAFEDREGNLWLGSLSNGVSRAWNGWTRRYSTQEGLPDATVWTLVPDPDGDGTWVGTNHGLAHLGTDGRFTRPAAGPVASSNALRTLYAEPGQLWIGLRNGLAVYRPGSGAPAEVPAWARGIRSPVSGLARDRDGNLWITTLGPLLRWNGTSLQEFGAADGLPGPVAEFRITRDGRRLALTIDTLLEFDGRRFVPAPEASDLPDDIHLQTLAELADGRLLLTNLDATLLLRHQNRWHRLDESTGLPPGTAFQALEHAGFLWVSGMHGVYRVPLEDLDAFAGGHIERVRGQVLLNERGMPNGGQQGLCCNGSGLADGFIADGALWLPTRDGVLALDTAAIVRNPVPPGVHVAGVQVGEQWRALERDAPVALDADERDITLAFDVLSYQDPRSNRARYRLAGYDRQWRTAGPADRQVRYTNLPPGDYVFEMLGSNNADVWAPAPARLEFGIRPHFHETAGFRALLAVLALLLVHAGYRYQRYRYRKRQRELEALVGERTAALAESNRQLEQASLTDPLTGLRNRRYLARQLPADLDYYDRQLAAGAARDEVVVFAMLDVDHFKQINDLHGHATGDRVLEDVARRMESIVRSGDYVVRWGGEEFLLVFRPMPSGQVPALGDRLRHLVSSTTFGIGGDRHLGLTASIGLSEYPLFRRTDGEPLGWEAMVELADRALYHVKRHGRDGWAMFRPTASTRTGTLVTELQAGPGALLAAGDLELLGSPMVLALGEDP